MIPISVYKWETLVMSILEKVISAKKKTAIANQVVTKPKVGILDFFKCTQ